MADVTIVICYQEGTLDMMETCLLAIQRHTKIDHDILLVTKVEGNGYAELKSITEKFGLNDLNIWKVGPEADRLAGRVHGAMLDHCMGYPQTEYILTLDSDCFPVAEGWLGELVEMMQDPEVGCAGILHPWGPPPEDMERNKIEWRVRSQHCWETTHVACQLVRRSFLEDYDLKYSIGDDTGLEIPKRVKELGLRCAGWKPTRCANPQTDKFDAEFNRYVCIIWGDRVYHHGGHTRKSMFQEDKTFDDNFGWVLPIVMAYHGAEFLLDDPNSYQYTLDREADVAAEKMQRLFGLKQDRMSG